MLTIKTHAAFGVEIGVQYGVSLSNNPKISDFWITGKSERFAGFSEIEIQQSELDMRLFHHGKSFTIDRILGFVIVVSKSPSRS
jgi:hypothetical protein